MIDLINGNEIANIDIRNLTCGQIADEVNKLLNEKGLQGFTRLETLEPVDNDICDVVGTSRGTYDTHKTLVFLEPIKEEKVECYCVKIREYLKTLNDVISQGRHRACFVNYCPECGEAL